MSFPLTKGGSVESNAASKPNPPSPKILDRVRWHLRVKHYSLRTEELYVQWIRRFILFHGNVTRSKWAKKRSPLSQPSRDRWPCRRLHPKPGL